jgi:Protein of unknown function (DUF4242)
MKTYIVERNLSGLEFADIFRLASAAYRAAATLSSDGGRVYYLGSTFLPEDGRCLCLFEADCIDVVDRLNRAEALPFDRISRAFSIPSPTVMDRSLPWGQSSSRKVAASNTRRTSSLNP